MRVLTKPNLDNAILLKELILIMENFGIFESGVQPDEGEIESVVKDDIDNDNLDLIKQ